MRVRLAGPISFQYKVVAAPNTCNRVPFFLAFEMLNLLAFRTGNIESEQGVKNCNKMDHNRANLPILIELYPEAQIGTIS